MPICATFFGFMYLMYKYQLLYVYVTTYQAGGFMWYAVFSRSMVALLGGVLTLICYMGVRETFVTGPFYLLLPLPFLIVYFWYYCEAKFKMPSMVRPRACVLRRILIANDVDTCLRRRCEMSDARTFPLKVLLILTRPSTPTRRLRQDVRL
jgi:Calcium-dependent channel, 7TM region, putative phosphate